MTNGQSRVRMVGKRLFEDAELGSHLIFKGGTSLSKCYGLIERFSEDIDLTISRRASYLSDGKNPGEDGISGKEREQRIDVLKQNAKAFVEKAILPKLKDRIGRALGKTDTWNVVLDDEDPDRQTILFNYPRLFNYGMGYGKGLYGVGNFGEGQIGYIKPSIKLEFGARGKTEPSEARPIRSYVAETFPDKRSGSEAIRGSHCGSIVEPSRRHPVCHKQSYRGYNM